MENNKNQELSDVQEQVEKTKELIKNNEKVPGMEDVVEFARAKLLGLEEKVTTILKTSESQVSQVEEQGGSQGEVVERTQGVDKKIEEVKVETTEQIKEVESKGVEENKIKNENQEKSTDTTQEKNSEIKNESDIETVKLNSRYSEILNKEEPINKKISELGKKHEAHWAEQRKLKETGNNEERLKEIEKELEKDTEEGKKLQWGEKVYGLIQQRDEINNKKFLIGEERYDYYKERSKYDDKEKRLKDLEEENKKINEMLTSVNNEENGLDGLKREAGKLRMEFSKKYGYDENFAKEAKDKLGSGIGENDGNRIVINNYLGLELPIFSREFKLKDIGTGRIGINKFDFIQDDSSDGRYNKSLLAQKQLALWEKVKEAREVLSKLSKEDRLKLANENLLMFDALKSVSGSQNQPIENNISDVFMPMSGVGKAMYLDSLEDKNLFPEKGIKVGDEILTPYAFETKMYSDSNYMMNALILHKLAKENGLLK